MDHRIANRHPAIQDAPRLDRSRCNFQKQRHFAISNRHTMLSRIALHLGKQTSTLRHQLIEILCLFALQDGVDTCFHLMYLR